MTDHHFYTAHPQTDRVPGFHLEGDVGHVLLTPVEGTVPFFRFFNPQSGDHFYTTDPDGEGQARNGWVNEGIACHVFPADSTRADTVPLYRWVSDEGDHFYCLDQHGELGPASGYRPEGIACRTLSEPVAGSVPLTRWFNGRPDNYCAVLLRDATVVGKVPLTADSPADAEHQGPAALDTYNAVAADGYRANRIVVQAGKC
jgi:hypothetical protein